MEKRRRVLLGVGLAGALQNLADFCAVRKNATVNLIQKTNKSFLEDRSAFFAGAEGESFTAR